MSAKLNARQPFAVGQRVLAGATVLSPSGSLTHETCEALEAALEAAAAVPRPIVVIDVRGVNVIDSASLDLLEEWHEKLEAAGGKMRLANLNDVCADIMLASRLLHVLNISRDVDQAVQAG